MTRGKFITFEGPEGSGKTTQAKILCDALHSVEIEAWYLREPGGTPIGEKIRSLLLDKSSNMTPMTEFLLFSAARAEIVETVIKPALERGVHVICDRFTDSSLAIQGRARGLPDAYVERINMIAVGNLVPDLTILLDIDVKEGLKRVAERGGENRIDLEGVEFHEKVRQEYLVRGMMSPNRFAYVPSQKSVHEVATNVCEIAAHVLGINRLPHNLPLTE